ncbi:MAG: hypothetical protein ACO1TE_14365 [Prosthecobacter sp.]
MRSLPFLLLCLCCGPLLHGAGLSEPNIILYGKVTNVADTPAQVLHVGELVWTITPPAGAPFTIPVALENLAGGACSYRLDIPAEKVPSGYTLSTHTVDASTTTKTYTLGVTLDGGTATMVLPDTTTHPGTTTYSEAARGKIERIDLEVSTAPLDSDGDGMSDAFENRFAGVLDSNNSGDAFNDPDADGVVNIAEFLDGTDPSCFEWIKWLAANNLTTPTLSDPNADPDKDGTVNLMEYALGTDPRTPDSRQASLRSTVTVEMDGGHQHLTCNIQRPGTRHCSVDYLVETSDNLQDWYSIPGQNIVSLLNQPTQMKIRDAAYVGQPGTGRRFIRMKLVYKP